MEVSSQCITKLLDVLAERQLIERIVNPRDRRVTYASLTDLGRQACLDQIPIAVSNMEAHFEGFSEEEKRLLQVLLSRLHTNMVRLISSD